MDYANTRKMMAKSFWSGLFGYAAPAERFSLQELHHLHQVLLDNSNVTEHNTASVVEALRALSELMIWGDQHDPRFFDYFLENNLMRFFAGFLEKPSNRRGEVAQQVLQTLYILIQNIKKETSLYYIFSNNHINDIVTLSFDFEEDEVLGYYINLLKTISLRLTPKIVQLFFQDDGKTSAFPLYTEAIKLINHREGMVRAAVRTLTLNVYKLEDEAIRDFLISEPASNFFNELSIIISEQCQTLDRKLSSLEVGTSQAAYSIETELNGLEDLMSYANDILCTGESRLVNLALKSLWEGLISPQLLKPLEGLASRSGETQGILPLTSLCIFERLFSVMSHHKLTNSLACALLLPARDVQNDSAKRWQPHGSCRAGFLESLKCGDTVLATAAVRVIAALMQNIYLDPEILDTCGLLSQARRKKRDLIHKLTSGMSFTSEEGDPAQQTHDSAKDLLGRVSQRPSMDLAFDTGSSGWLGNLRGMSSADGIWEDALYSLLGVELLPCTALWLLGQILVQLNPDPGPGDSVGSSKDHTHLHSAFTAAQRRFSSEIDSIWSDALPLLVTHEWPRPFQETKGTTSLTSGTAVQSWMQAIQNQKVALDTGPENAKGRSAHKAAAILHIVQSYIAIYQIHQALLMGTSGPTPLPIVPATEAVMKRLDVREGFHLALKDHVSCSVSFAQGAETAAMFAVHGIPEVSWNDAEESSSECLTDKERAAVASCCPIIVLARPTSTPGTGSVISTAPLVGAACHVDKGHARWLHVHVRPQARALIKAVRASKQGENVSQLEKLIVDGHWVLAFQNADAAFAAADLVSKKTALLKRLVKDCLSPML